MEKNYDVTYFIKKFEAIPENKWLNEGLSDYVRGHQMCAMGHCGKINAFTENNESKSLKDLFMSHNLIVINVNDGFCHQYLQSTAKQRILAALYDIKAMQDGEATTIVEKPQPKWKDITSELAVFPVEEKSDLKTVKEIV